MGSRTKIIRRPDKDFDGGLTRTLRGGRDKGYDGGCTKATCVVGRGALAAMYVAR
jgi:hypothetical protein